MLYLYPSNKLEHLSELLNAVMQRQSSLKRTHVLQATEVLVESTGMQHWLNLQLAQSCGIAFNLSFPMPTRYIWQISRALLGDDKVPLQSSYKREVLMWRIHDLLDSEAFLQQGFDFDIKQYWLSVDAQQQSVDKFSLCRLLADTFEQYLMFRPQWLLAWEDGKSIMELDASDREAWQTQDITRHEQWQRWIWLALVQQEPLHPARLQSMALAHMQQTTGEELSKNLPKDLYIFAINTMSRSALAFYDALAQHMDIHFFHLNPCVNYWGDAKADATIATQVRQGRIDSWLEDTQLNDLLRNYGQQGKELFQLIGETRSYEIAAFEGHLNLNDEASDDFKDGENDQGSNTNKNNQQAAYSLQSMSLLKAIQEDILWGENGKCAALVDESHLAHKSVQLHSCHSAHREVQVLHDKLLHLLHLNPSVQPHDVLVICPKIEDYAVYIPSVFNLNKFRTSQGAAVNKQWQNTAAIGGAPTADTRLPCSVADRSAIESEPLVACFLQLLNMPTSRFSANELITWLYIPAVQQKFGFDEADIPLCEHWVQQANIYWGLDGQHKARILANGMQASTQEQVSAELDARYTWQWGLEKLLQGMISSDQHSVLGQQFILNEVQGQHSVVLGRLLQFIEQLVQHSQQLQATRYAKDWMPYLLSLRDDVFAQSEEHAFAIELIGRAIKHFIEHFDMAERLSSTEEGATTHCIEIGIVAEVLEQALSMPDNKNGFMTGQVTFCSMVPMRSIPFKVVAVLGLNEADFPRKNIPIDIDLMALNGTQLGDRSRRGDDRYLFLEAILSAREHLYLSYQGKHIKNNNERQASLVLTEFMRYCRAYFPAADLQLTQQSLHPFSIDNFTAQQAPSFDQGWYRVMQSLQELQANEQDTAASDIAVNEFTQLDLDTLTRLLKDPLKAYANRSLHLYLEQQSDDSNDHEPFVMKHLDHYDVVHSITETLLHANSDNAAQQMIDEQVQEWLLSGDLPNTPSTLPSVQDWCGQAQMLSTQLSSLGEQAHHGGSITLGEVSLAFYFRRIKQSGALAYHFKPMGCKHLMQLWLEHLVLACSDDDLAKHDKGWASHYVYLDKNSRTGEVLVKQGHFTAISAEQAQLHLRAMVSFYQQAMHRPIPLYPSLGESVLKAKKTQDYFPLSMSITDLLSSPVTAQVWQKCFDDNAFAGAFTISDNAYYQHFFKQAPDLDEALFNDLLAIYAPLMSAIQGEEK